MKISYSYRGVKTHITADFRLPKLGINGDVVFSQSGLTDGNQKMRKVTIKADDLLKTASACLRMLGELLGVNYAVAVSVNDGDYKILEHMNAPITIDELKAYIENLRMEIARSSAVAQELQDTLTAAKLKIQELENENR